MTGKNDLLHYDYKLRSRWWRIYDALRPFLIVTYAFTCILIIGYVLLVIQQHHTKCL